MTNLAKLKYHRSCDCVLDKYLSPLTPRTSIEKCSQEICHYFSTPESWGPSCLSKLFNMVRLLRCEELEMWSGKPLNFDTPLLLQLPLHRFFGGLLWLVGHQHYQKLLHENAAEAEEKLRRTAGENKHLAKASIEIPSLDKRGKGGAAQCNSAHLWTVIVTATYQARNLPVKYTDI